jgi:hypothetical protein
MKTIGLMWMLPFAENKLTFHSSKNSSQTSIKRYIDEQPLETTVSWFCQVSCFLPNRASSTQPTQQRPKNRKSLYNKDFYATSHF